MSDAMPQPASVQPVSVQPAQPVPTAPPPTTRGAAAESANKAPASAPMSEEEPTAPPKLPSADPISFSEGFEEDEETRVLRIPSEFVQQALAERSVPPENAGETIRAPEPAAGSDEARADGEEAPTAPPRMGPLSPQVPLAPRVPSISSTFGAQAPSQVPSNRAPTEDPVVPRTPIRSQMPTLDHVGPSSIPPPAIAPSGAPADPIAREAWISRAEWLETEAHAATDPQAKARALLVASELWAIVGDVGRAREVATEASAITRQVSMVGRQLRWLAALEGDWKSVASLLELEARSATTGDARVHASYLCAEVNRLELDDREATKKKFDLSVRAQAEDARAHVQRLAEQLGQSSAPPKLRLPELPELAELSRTIEEIARLRVPGPQAPAPLAAFEDARRALSSGDRGQAASAVLKLVEVEGLERPARWLAAALLAHEGERRSGALQALSELLSETSSASARRALAARALETGNTQGLLRALEGGSEAVSVADRVALAALGGVAMDVDALTGELAAAEGQAALAAGTLLAQVGPTAREPEAGAAAARSALTLGRRLARPPQDRDRQLGWLSPAIEAFRSLQPDHALARTLTLEHSVAKRDLADVAGKLSDFPKSGEGPASARDGELASALCYELSGSLILARQAYERALLAAPTSEFAARALMALDPESAADLVERLADAEGVGTASALHFSEAALRRGGDGPHVEALLDRAAQADPKLTLPHHLGERLARSQPDADRALGWLRSRRALASDPVETALELTREALFVRSTNTEGAVALIKEALDAQPQELPLWELLEQLSQDNDVGRAGFREAAGARANGATRVRLWLEAAREFARKGEADQAAAIALKALDTNVGTLSRVIFERLAPSSSDSTRLADELITQAKDTEDPERQREFYDRLYDLDRARGQAATAFGWQNAILERSPHYLPALRRLEVAHMANDRKDELESVEAGFTQALSGTDRIAHARLSARLRLAAGSWGSARHMAEISLAENPNSLWALRMLAAHARAADQPEVLLDVERKLSQLSSSVTDKATLSLRASESAARLGRWEEAQALLEETLAQIPEHLVALTTLSEVLERRRDFAAAARALEAVADASRVDAHRVNALYQAGVIWLDHVVSPEQGRQALERAVELDLSHEDAVARLQALYVARGDHQKLAELLARRLERTTDPEERIAIEVTRGRALAEVGEPAAARAALSAALDANPDHLEALEAFAEVCLTEGDWTGAEQALIRLARHSVETSRQAQIYRRLGELYDTNIPNPDRAELAYHEVLKREPDDDASVDRLVAVYARMGQKEKAVQAQQQLLERSNTPELRRDRTLRLSAVLEQVASDVKRAEAVLEKARKEWPYDALLLRALVALHQRSGEGRAGHVLLDRAAVDARRALATGRFEPALFEILAAVADLRGNADGAAVAHATLAALGGEELGVRGAGPAAGDPGLDDLLAPELLAPALRALLRRTGDILDTAYPVDPRTLRATALPPTSSAYLAHVQDVGRAFGFPSVHVLVSPTLGATCLPASSSPAVLVFGQALLESPDDAARYCLLVRALKVLQGRSGAVARTAPIDLWPVIAALLNLLAPSFTPQAVDAKKLADARARIQAVMPAQIDDELPTLAIEATGLIGNRASQLATALYQWGDRTALLAVGDPMVLLRAIATASGTSTPPSAGAERIKWIVRNAEARDMAVFSVSDHYAEARRRLGLR
jgi:tetratricopeptide (TPR) repeat protein